MNWMGGARNRIKLQEEKKRQKDFFSRKRQSSHLDFVSSNETKKKVCSQDLLLFETIEKIFNDTQPKSTIDPKKKVPHAELKERVVKFHTPKLPISPSYFPSVLDNASNDTCVNDTQPQQQITSTHLQNWCSKLNQHFEKEIGNTPVAQKSKPNGKFPNHKTHGNMQNITKESETLMTPQLPGQRGTHEQMELYLIQNVVNYQASTSKRSTPDANIAVKDKLRDRTNAQTPRTPVYKEPSGMAKIDDFVEPDCERFMKENRRSYKAKSPITGVFNSVNKENNEQENGCIQLVPSACNQGTIQPDPTSYQKDFALWQEHQKNELYDQLAYKPIPLYTIDLDGESEKGLNTLPSTPLAISPIISSGCITFDNKEVCDNELQDDNSASVESPFEKASADCCLTDKKTQTDVALMEPPVSEKCEAGIQTDKLCCTCTCRIQKSIYL